MTDKRTGEGGGDRTDHTGTLRRTHARADGGTAGGGTVVAVTAPGAAVVAADPRTTGDGVVTGESARKLAPVHPTAAMGSAGSPGTVQSVVRRVRSAADREELRRGDPLDLPALARLAAEELRSGGSDDARVPGGATFLLGGADDDGAHAFVLDADGGAIEEAYAAAGTGQAVAYGVLDDSLGSGALDDQAGDEALDDEFGDEDLDDDIGDGDAAATTGAGKRPAAESTTAARRVAARALESAAARDPRTGDGLVVATATDA
ncbi:MAG: hypothetical protein V5A23_08680, partial [Halobacteriales archaeon]